MNIQTIVTVFGVISVYTVTVVGFGFWFSNIMNGIETRLMKVLDDKHKENTTTLRDIRMDHSDLDKRISMIEFVNNLRSPTYPLKDN